MIHSVRDKDNGNLEDGRERMKWRTLFVDWSGFQQPTDQEITDYCSLLDTKDPVKDELASLRLEVEDLRKWKDATSVN